MLTNILIFVVILGGFGIFALRPNMGSRKEMQKRVERIKERKGEAPKAGEDVSLRRKSTEIEGRLINWLMKPLPDFKRLGDKLNRAGLTVTPKQYALRHLLIALLIAAVVAFIFKKSILLGLSLGIIFGIWLPFKILQRKVAKKTKAFLALFPDAIDLIVRGLRSGLPVSESMKLVAHEVPDPVGGIFANMSNMMKLGVSLDKALTETAHMLDTTEFNFFTTSIILQRETGGNLAEILNNLSEVLRSRFMMRMKIKAMSSEARASSYIIGALPFVVTLAVAFTSPGYMSPLIDDYRGNVCAGVAAFMMIFGIWTMNRMTKFEI